MVILYVIKSLLSRVETKKNQKKMTTGSISFLIGISTASTTCRIICRRSPASDKSPGAFLSCHDLWGHDTKTPHFYSAVLSFIIPAARNSGNRYIIISEKFVIQHLVSVSSCRITPHRKSCRITILVSVSLRSCCQEEKINFFRNKK